MSGLKGWIFKIWFWKHFCFFISVFLMSVPRCQCELSWKVELDDLFQPSWFYSSMKSLNMWLWVFKVCILKKKVKWKIFLILEPPVQHFDADTVWSINIFSYHRRLHCLQFSLAFLKGFPLSVLFDRLIQSSCWKHIECLGIYFPRS